MGAAHIEGVVGPHPVAGPGQLVGQGVRIGGGRLGVGHFEHGDDPAEGGGAGAGLQVFLPLQPRLAEMDLGVDDAGQDRQAAGVNNLARRGLRQVADEDDPPVGHADVGQAAARMVGHLAAADDQVIGLGHGSPHTMHHAPVILGLDPRIRPTGARLKS